MYKKVFIMFIGIMKAFTLVCLSYNSFENFHLFEYYILISFIVKS